MKEAARRRKIRLQVTMAILYLGVSLLAFLIRDDLYGFLNIPPEIVLSLILSGTGIAFAILLMLYLRGDISFPPIERFITHKDYAPDTSVLDVEMGAQLSQVRDQVATLRDQLQQLSRLQVTAATGDREALLSDLRAQIAGDLATELEQRFAKPALDAAYVGQARQVFAASRGRLLGEIASLTRRGNLNLTIGVLTTMLAVGLLAYMVLTTSSTFTSFPVLLSYYIPRIATVVFVEVFSFFFLKLYRGSMTEVKFYQNELTTLAAHQIALEVSRATADEECGRLAVEQIARRNPNLLAESTSTGAHGPLETGHRSHLGELTEILERISKLVVDTAKR